MDSSRWANKPSTAKPGGGGGGGGGSERHYIRGLVDLHSAGQAKTSGDGGIEHHTLFPYLDSLWIGENAEYERGPDHWLTSLSGLPFGVPSQMLGASGSLYRGLVHGMHARPGMSVCPKLFALNCLP